MIHPDDDVLLDLCLEDHPADVAVREHVYGCPTCADRVEAHRRTMHLLRDEEPVPSFDAPAGTWAAIRAAIDEEERPVAAVPVTTGSTPAHPRARWWWLGGGVAAGLLVGIAAGVAFAPRATAPTPTAPPASTSPSPPVVAAARLAALQGSTDGRAVLTRDADGTERLDVRVPGMTPPKPGEVYEVWLLHRNGSQMVALGLMPGGPKAEFTVPADLVAQGYQIVDVSREPLDEDATHSGDSLLRGSLEP